MNLLEAIESAPCPELRKEMERFMGTVRENVIVGEGCPVCRTNLQSSFEITYALRELGLGRCTVCGLKIQMHHRIAHKDHVLNEATGQMCAYEISLPVSHVHHSLLPELAAMWKKMNLPRRPFTPSERDKKGAWEYEALRIAGKRKFVEG